MNTLTTELLKSLDVHVDEVTRKKIMATCGEKCPYTHLTDTKLLEVRETSKDQNELLKSLCEVWHLKKENGEYYVVFDQCYCPIAKNNFKNTSKTLCYCTVGNLRHKFKLALGREVQIETIKTILNGDDECRFHVKLHV